MMKNQERKKKLVRNPSRYEKNAREIHAETFRKFE